ncbi:MAG: HAD-IB family phosphatase [Gammaproteobacteria bacterium]|nr:HAD-IB family phosphatase [Gammaproteobacteria bacterium]
MIGGGAGQASLRLAVFDLDGTLTWRDSLAPFLAGYLRLHPRRLPRLWRVPAAVGAYVGGSRDRGALKSRLIQIAMAGEPRAAVDAWADAYVRALGPRGAYRADALRRVERHRASGDLLILLSASPDLYVPRIGAALGFAATLCTEVRWQGDRLDGRLITPNRRGEEKRRCLERLRQLHPGATITAYGNSASDFDHLRAADHGVLVNAGRSARRAAGSLGLDVEEWR